MTFLEFLSVVRRRWIYVAIGLVAGLVGGFVTAPGVSDAPERFEGTHTLLVDPGSGITVNLQQSALLADTGPVPVRVEERLTAEGLALPLDVDAIADIELGSLEVTAIATTRESAATAANYTAEEINAELAAEGSAEFDEQLQLSTSQLEQARAEVGQLDSQLSGLEEDDPARPALQAERDALASEIPALEERVRALEEQGRPTPPLKSLEAAEGQPEVVEGWRLPDSRAARALMLGALGAALGLLGAFAADRLDTRVRGKADAERAFDLPVIAEIPPLPGGTKSRDLQVVTRPASPFVESYRALRTVVLFAAAERDSVRAKDGHGTNGNGVAQAQVVLITSPAAGDGKTTTAAHLAAVLAENDKRVLVISADFRRPRIHEYFGVGREPGLSDVLDSGPGRVRLSDLQMATTFGGVHLLPSGSPVTNPAQMLTETAHLVASAKQLFDYIVVDTPPLLVANDATELAADADMVLLVAKADRTSRDAAHRAAEILRRVEAPLLGVVIAAAHDTPTAYGYYRYRYYSESDQGRGARRRLRRGAKEAAPAVVGAGASTASK